MAAFVPEMDVAIYLASAGIGLTLGGLGGNLFTGPPLPATIDGHEGGVPGLCVFVDTVGGPPPEPYFGRQGSLYIYSVQIHTRSAPSGRAAGVTLARAVRAALHEATIPIASGGNYVLCLALNASPLYIGADAALRHRWSQNLDLRAVETP